MKRLFKIIIVTGLVFIFLVVLLNLGSRYNNVQENSEVPIILDPAVPTMLSIESIGVSAPVESVGVLGNAMAVPMIADNVGWYDLGTRPGDTGSAVLAGHVNWMGGQDAVFTNLKAIQIDDIVSVTDNYGVTHDFIVRDIKRYPVDADTSEVFSSNDGLARLNLITCDGLWSVAKGTHDSRLVIFTEKI